MSFALPRKLDTVPARSKESIATIVHPLRTNLNLLKTHHALYETIFSCHILIRKGFYMISLSLDGTLLLDSFLLVQRIIYKKLTYNEG